MQISEFIISASGTTTLEAAILDTPQIICYQAALTTYFLAKYVFKVEFVGLPNIIAGEEVVPDRAPQTWWWRCSGKNSRLTA
jgi:lipid-A-disaccharide synthase